MTGIWPTSAWRFIESSLLDSFQARDEVFDYYYTHALALAKD